MPEPIKPHPDTVWVEAESAWDQKQARASVQNTRLYCYRQHKQHHVRKETSDFLYVFCKICNWFCLRDY